LPGRADAAEARVAAKARGAALRAARCFGLDFRFDGFFTAPARFPSARN